MSKNLKPCPKCNRESPCMAWEKTDDYQDLPRRFIIGCPDCAFIMEGSTVRVLTAGSKASSWRRTKAKWNKIERQAT